MEEEEDEEEEEEEDDDEEEEEDEEEDEEGGRSERGEGRETKVIPDASRRGLTKAERSSKKRENISLSKVNIDSDSVPSVK